MAFGEVGRVCAAGQVRVWASFPSQPPCLPRAAAVVGDGGVVCD